MEPKLEFNSVQSWEIEQSWWWGYIYYHVYKKYVKFKNHTRSRGSWRWPGCGSWRRSWCETAELIDCSTRSSSATGNLRSSAHHSIGFDCRRPHWNCWDSLWSSTYYSCLCSSAGSANQWPPCTSSWWSLSFGPVLCSCRCMSRKCFPNFLCA